MIFNQANVLWNVLSVCKITKAGIEWQRRAWPKGLTEGARWGGGQAGLRER